MSAVFLSAVHDIIKYESKIIQTIYLKVFNENWNKIKEQAFANFKNKTGFSYLDLPKKNKTLKISVI
jgi:hypothetical protein